MKYGYYPGCSLERNAIAYHQSALAVAEELDVDLVEVQDWNCCGATEYIAIDLIPAYALITRNLALAQQQKLNENGDSGPNQLIAPCSACFLNLSKADKYLKNDPPLAKKTNEALAAGGLSYDPGSVRVRHLLDIFVNDVGYEAVAEKVSKPLYNLRIAPYYGCLIVRPSFAGAYDDPEYPTTLDHLMRSLGATVVDYPVKAHCCGGHMTQISERVALDLIHRLLKNAADYNADMIVTLCPMCQLNLDGYQDAVNKHFGTNYNIPILYFTQLMGLAMGMAPKELGFGREFVSANPALDKDRSGTAS
jgi:heterodisulfide reductase subunit B